MIEPILADKTVVITNKTAEFSLTVRANEFVVMDLACTRVSGCARECVSALLTTDHSLHDTWLDGASARSYFVLLQEFLSMGEAFLAYCTLKVVTGNFTTNSVCAGSSVKRIPDARASYKKARALARWLQELK